MHLAELPWRRGCSVIRGAPRGLFSILLSVFSNKAPFGLPPIILTRETGTRIHMYYFEKIPKNDTSVLRTESKETPHLGEQRAQQGLIQSNPRHPILNTK